MTSMLATAATPTRRPPRTSAATAATVAAGTLGGAVAVGTLAALSPKYVIALLALAAIAVAVWSRPAVAAVLAIFVSPLVAGIDRGRLLPVLRPNEALDALLIGILATRMLVLLKPGERLRLRLSPLETTLVLMAVCNSIVPIALMLLRGRTVESDDISYALVLWKYLAVYGIVRATVHTEREVRWCLWASVLAAMAVAAVGVLQALDLAGVRGMLQSYYAPFGYTGALAQPRGGSTLALPAAAADLLMLNLAIAVGLWWKDRRHRTFLIGAGVLFVLGTLAAAEFSSALGLLVAGFCIALALGRLDLLRYAPVALVPAGAILWPVIDHRIIGFQSVAGLPISWTTRWLNLKTYFWPVLFHGWNPVLGVRPAARVVVQAQGTGFVWIESGYTWLLWGGGLPLLVAFVLFVRVGLRTLWPICRTLASSAGTYSAVAALSAFTGVAVCALLMIFDPHLTYRGAADCLFALLALATVRDRFAPAPERSPAHSRHGGQR